MTEKRFIPIFDGIDKRVVGAKDNGKIISFMDMFDLLNEQEERIQELEIQLNNVSTQRDEFYRGARENANRIGKLEKENEELKQDIEYLDEKIKENEWHWNTIDEDRDVWHYKCTQAEKKVEELKEEKDEIKSKAKTLLDFYSKRYGDAIFDSQKYSKTLREELWIVKEVLNELGLYEDE